LKKLKSFRQQANQVLVGKSAVIDQALCCLIANGHLLIEDIPGVGKTTLVKLLADLLSLSTNRIQCTNDLLPADIIGGNTFDPNKQEFKFHKGPIFTNLLIADELNRATPKTQSACLQAMEEKEISIDGKTYQLPDPFFIIATQNPEESIGTFPLPESQLDRFLMKIKIGYPERKFERQVLETLHHNTGTPPLPVMTLKDLQEAQITANNVHIKPSVFEYIQDIICESRTDRHGLSTRAAIDLVKASKAWALINDRDFCIPDDVKSVFTQIASHRLGCQDPRTNPSSILKDILSRVSPP
tara:strand:- start:108 stop:1004 length:897 start_codon:yes stop_codon:yes gene_type:complete